MAAGGDVRWDITVPQIFPGTQPDIELVRRFVVRAEELGYTGLWVQEHIEEYEPSFEPLELLSYVAALTSRAVLGTSVLLTIFRNPVHLAKTLATLDTMSGGRLVIGVGLGAEPTRYPAFGIAPDRRVRQFMEGLRVMKLLWTERSPSFQGDFWQLDNTPMYPKPVQSPHPPIWFGGRNPAVLRRAVRMGSGWIGAGGSTTEVFRQNVADLRAILDQEGRDPRDFPIAKRVYIALDNDRGRAEERVRSWFGQRYNNAEMGSRVSVWGSAEDCATGLREVVDAGAGLIQLNPMFDHMEHLEGLMRDVVSRV